LLIWLTLLVDVEDSVVDGVNAEGVVGALVVEVARMRRKNGFPSPSSVVL
jgi:hypothetical protein